MEEKTMYKHLKFVSTVNMPYEEWLERRKKTIGGSDAAAVVGLNAFSSPYSLWAEKTGRVPGFAGNLATEVGTYLEDFVAKKFAAETGKKVRKINKIIFNPDFSFAHVNIDRDIVGEDACLECKTTSDLNMKKFRNGEYPSNYYVQCVHTMAVTGIKRMYLAVLIGNRDFRVFTIERDEEEIAALMRQEESFWECVKTDTPPAVDGAPATSDTLKTIYSGANGESIELFGRDELFGRYEELTAQKSEIDAEIEKIKQQLMSDLREAESATCGAWSVSWKRQTRKTFDVEAFKEQNPSVKMEPYYKFSASRVMRISKKSEKSEV